jgi:EpsI family protein
MIDRRDMIFGLGCAAAAGGALWMRPDEYVRLMPDKKLEAAVPEQFGPWAIDRGLGVVLPPSEGSLADRLYDEVMARAYYQPASQTARPVMCLMTYGARQSDALQLHRPETCYPAVGFQLVSHRKAALPLASGASLPIVEITARLGERFEDVLYWTRVGEDLPQDSGEQRRKRLRASLAGQIGDGVLVRMSSARLQESAPGFPALRAFARDMLGALTPATRRGLVGTKLAAAIR